VSGQQHLDLTEVARRNATRTELKRQRVRQGLRALFDYGQDDREGASAAHAAIFRVYSREMGMAPEDIEDETIAMVMELQHKKANDIKHLLRGF